MPLMVDPWPHAIDIGVDSQVSFYFKEKNLERHFFSIDLITTHSNNVTVTLKAYIEDKRTFYVTHSEYTQVMCEAPSLTVHEI